MILSYPIHMLEAGLKLYINVMQNFVIVNQYKYRNNTTLMLCKNETWKLVTWFLILFSFKFIHLNILVYEFRRRYQKVDRTSPTRKTMTVRIIGYK